MHCPEIGRSDTQVGRPRQRVIFARMAGLLAMPTLLPEGVLSAEGCCEWYSLLKTIHTSTDPIKLNGRGPVGTSEYVEPPS